MDRANKYIDIPINTGLSFDYRSLILVHSSDALIMVGGGNGVCARLKRPKAGGIASPEIDRYNLIFDS